MDSATFLFFWIIIWNNTSMYHEGYEDSIPVKKVKVMLNNYFFAVLMCLFMY